MKKIVFLFVFLSSLLINAQEERSMQMGQTSMAELQMTSYDKDPSAPAVILYDEGNYYIDEKNDYDNATDYYRRVKIINKDQAQDLATVSIVTPKKYRVLNIQGATYTLQNGLKKKVVLQASDIFVTDLNSDFKKTSFTLPNISSGCVIEYSYKVLSPYLGITDWYFQSNVPTARSVFKTAIIGNYKYNIKLGGLLDLTESKSVVDKRCFTLPDGRVSACASSTYAINNVPAFQTEDYMLSAKNYLARMSFNLESVVSAKQAVGGYDQGVKRKTTNYTKTWKDTDKKVRLDVLNNQGAKKNFFKRQLTESILDNPNTLERAKQVYGFIQDRYSWNEENWSYGNLKIKKSFDERTGNVEEINLALYNSLQAAKIESYITFVSTRDNGIPTKLFPVIYDFNYIIIKTVVDGKEYFLDATNKYRPFGEIPFKCLNGEARVFDFKKGSYWQNLNTLKIASEKSTIHIALDEEGHILAKIAATSNGYNATDIRNTYAKIGEEEYLRELSQGLSDSEIENYTINNLKLIEQPIEENYQIISDDSYTDGKNIRIFPVLRSRRGVNPFQLKERLYPVDFGYRRSLMHRITIDIPKGYQVTQLPQKVGVKLPNNGGAYLYQVQQNNEQVRVFIRFNINKKIFSPEEYFYLKEFYNKIIEAESSFIELEKIK
jgi:hypothetical protein